MAIPFLSPIKASGNIRLANSGKLFLWNDHDSNYLMYDRWRASASAGMNIQNVSGTGSIFLRSGNALTLTLDSNQNVIAADAFTGKLQGAVTGAPDTTIWRVSGQYTNWGIFYNEGSPDKIEFKAGGTVTSTIALDNGDITTSGNVSLADGKAIKLGSGGTFQLWHQSGTNGNSFIDEQNTGELYIRSNSTIRLAHYANNTASANFNPAGAVELYYNTSKKIETTNTGVSVTGALGVTNIDMTGILDISATYPRINLNDTNHEDDWSIINADGSFTIYNVDDALDALHISASNNATFAGNVDITGTKITMDTIMLQDTAGGRLGFNRDTSNGNIHDSTYNAYQIQNNTGASQGGKLEIQEYNSNGAYAGSTFITGNKLYLNDYVVHNGDENTYYGFETSDTWRVVVGGGEAINVNTSRIRINKHIEPSADSTYNIGTNSVRFSNIYADTLHGTVALSSEASNLGSFDDRDMAPEDMSFSDDLKLFFVEKSGIEGGTVGSNWQDALFISSYVDASGGNPNLLAFDKSEKKIYHYQASATATSWGTPKELAYTSDFVKRTGGTSTSMSGNLHIISGAPKIYLQDNTDDDDQQIIFRNSSGGDDYKITTQDFTSAGTGDGLFIGSETTDPVKLVTNDTIALAIDSSQHISLPGAYLTLKDLNSHAQIEASSSTMFLKAANLQAQGNLIPDGTGNRSLGASNRYWSETYTNGVTSGGNIVINSNTPVLTLGVVNSSTGNSKIQFYSKNSGASNGYAVQYNKDTGIDRLEFIDGSGTANIKFNNGGAAEFAGSVTATQINTGQGATEVHLMNQNLRTTDDVTFDNLIVTGNITVTGDLNTVSVTDLDVSDKTITVGVGQSEANSGGSGLKVSGPSTQPSILWNESNDTWDFNYGIDVNGNINVDTQSTDILIGDNDSDALEVKQGSNLYMRFNTTNGGEKIEINKPVEATFINASTGFRMDSGQAIDFIDTNIGYNSIKRNTTLGGIQITTGGNSSMNLLDNGNVGVGGAHNPGGKFQVDDYTVASQGNQTSYGVLNSFANSGATNLFLGIKNAAYPNRGWSLNSTTNGVNCDLVFYEFGNNGERMRLTTTGKLGIGTNSPTGVLDVLSTDAQRYARFRAPNGEERFEFHIGSTGNGARLSMYDHDGTTEGVRLSASGNSYLNNSSKLGINTNSPQEVFSVTGGNIALDNGGDYILGGATTSSIIGRLKNTSGVYTLDGEGTRNIRLGSETNGEVVRIDNTNGRVGIGTTSPSSKLHIESTGEALRFTRSGQETYRIIHGTSGLYFTEPDAGDLMFGVTQNSDFDIFDTSGNVMFRADGSAGRVGIGTSSPTNPLHVKNGDASGQNSYSLIKVENGTNHAEYGALSGYARIRAAGNEIMAGSYGATYFYNGGNTILTLIGTGVGIGTTSPAHKLDVNGGSIFIDSDWPLYLGSTSAFIEGNSTGTILRSNASAGFTWTDGGTTQMKLDTNGKLGIGTSSPTYKLSVTGAISGAGFVTYTKSYGSLNATGNAVAGITASANGNGSSCGFTFTCFGGTGKYQKVVYSCYNDAGTWRARKVIDEGTNDLDVAASADGSTITFTFKATSSSQNYTPRVKVEAEGHNINSTYA